MKQGGGKKAPKQSMTTETPSGQLGGTSKKAVTKINNLTSTGSALTPASGPGTAARTGRGKKS